jgi:hypothetical protein
MLISEAASAELAKQIEALAPSAAVLEATGFTWETAATLAKCISSGDISLEELRSHGLSQEAAVDIATSISKRHARKAAALAAVKPPPAPKPTPAVPAPKSDAMDGMSAMSQLHTLFQEAERGQRACLTTLINAGWSENTSRELVKVINASLATQRKIQ